MRPELIYSAQKRDFIRGLRYANPRHFSGPARNVSSVIVVGRWPEIVDSYRLQVEGVTIIEVRDPGELAALLEMRANGGGVRKAAPASFSPESQSSRRESQQTGLAFAPRANEITLPAPDEMASLAFPALRQLATQISGTPIQSRKEAEAIVAAERARRASA